MMPLLSKIQNLKYQTTNKIEIQITKLIYSDHLEIATGFYQQCLLKFQCGPLS